MYKDIESHDGKAVSRARLQRANAMDEISLVPLVWFHKYRMPFSGSLS